MTGCCVACESGGPPTCSKTLFRGELSAGLVFTFDWLGSGAVAPIHYLVHDGIMGFFEHLFLDPVYSTVAKATLGESVLCFPPSVLTFSLTFCRKFRFHGINQYTCERDDL